MPDFVASSSQTVDAVTAGVQDRPAVARLASGGFAVAWTDENGHDAWLQLFDASGQAVGGNELVFDGTGRTITNDVVALAGGGFAVELTTQVDDGAFSTLQSVLALRFDANAQPVGEDTVATESARFVQLQGDSVQALADGGFVATYHRLSVAPEVPLGGTFEAQRFDAAGAAVGGEVVLGSYSEPSSKAFTVLPDGTWLSATNVLDPTALFQVDVERHSPDGATLASMRLDPHPTGFEQFPATTLLADGNTLIAWEATELQGPPSQEIQFQEFDANGTPLTTVTSFASTIGPLAYPQLTALSDGGFLLSWEVEPTLGTPVYEVLGQHFDAALQLSGGLLVLAPPQLAANGTLQWDVTPTADSGFAVATEVAGDSTDVQFQLFAPAPPGQQLQGGNGRDALAGTAGDDTLSGGNGPDVLTGGSGDDLLNGGNGPDVAVFAGSRSDYTITRTGASSFMVAGPDGTDTLVDIEQARFDDALVTLDVHGNPHTPATVIGAVEGLEFVAS
jgi:hypothetical protein